jgi:hypothetical protein
VEGEDKRKKRVRRWTADEDEVLTRLVEQHGVGAWAHISTHFADRSAKQVRRGVSLFALI